jgi:hypothetical protein
MWSMRCSAASGSPARKAKPPGCLVSGTGLIQRAGEGERVGAVPGLSLANAIRAM